MTLTEWLTSTPLGLALLFGWPALCGGLAFYFRRRMRALAFAEWLVREGQYQKVDAPTLDALIMEADRLGKKSLLLSELAALRRKYGHDGIRRGHVMWLVQWLHGDIENGATPPSFAPPSE